MKKDLKYIFDKTDCLSFEEIKKYVSGQMNKDQIRRVELHLADCPMCSDEVEAYNLLSDKTKLAEIISDINNKIDTKLTSLKTIPIHSSSGKISLKRIVSIAASVVLLIGAGFIIRFYMNNSDKTTAENNLPVNKVENTDTRTTKVENKETKTVVPDEISEQKIKKEYEKLNENNVVEKTPEINIEPDNKIDGENDNNADITPDNNIISGNETTEDETEISEDIAVSDNSIAEEKSLSSASNDIAPAENGFITTMRGGIKMEKSNKKETEKYKSMRESGMLSYNMKIYAEALKDFNDYLKYKPSDFEIRYKTGLSYYNLGKYDKAVSHFNKLIDESINPYVEDAEWYKAKSLMKLNKNEEAKILLNKIITENGKYQNKALDLLNTLN